MNVSISSKIICWSPNFQSDSIWRWGSLGSDKSLNEITKVGLSWWVHWPYKKTREKNTSCMHTSRKAIWKHSEVLVVSNPKRMPSSGTCWSWTSSLQIHEKVNSVYGDLLWQPKRIKTWSDGYGSPLPVQLHPGFSIKGNLVDMTAWA